jgi:quinol monooxygenase YgiN
LTLLTLERMRPGMTLEAPPPSTSTEPAEIFIFARFQALPGREEDVEAAIREVRGPTREEPGCLSYNACRSIRDPRLFYIHTRWRDEGAFDLHASLPHTIRFIELIEGLIDHDLDVARTALING